MEWYGNIIRQLPGPWNALGGVKFVFPNGYDIYLHDTPSKILFKESTRTFSHGCIRISEPKKLAMFLLSNQGEWTEEAIDSAMTSRIEKFVPLKMPDNDQGLKAIAAIHETEVMGRKIIASEARAPQR